MNRLSRPRFEWQGGPPKKGGYRVRVRDVRDVIYRLRLNARYEAESIRDDGSPDTPKNFAYALYGVDAGLAQVLWHLNSAGYPTMASQSGLLRDYPGEKGVAADQGAEYGYILFFKLPAAKEKKIIKAAEACGMGTEPTRRGGWARGVRVDTAILRDGTRYNTVERPVRKEAIDRGIFHLARSSKDGRARMELAWMRLLNAALNAHGGLIDDEEVIERWACFTERLTGLRPTEF